MIVGAAAFNSSITRAETGLRDEIFALHASPVRGVKDSKRFSSHDARVRVAAKIQPYLVGPAGLGMVNPQEINEHGMVWAWETACTRALDGLVVELSEPIILLMDGTVPAPVPAHRHVTQFYQPRTDNLWWPVSAASILAKVKRDNLMMDLHQEFPHFGWASNKGYGTPAHIQALREHGPCYQHRTQFVETALSR